MLSNSIVVESQLLSSFDGCRASSSCRLPIAVELQFLSTPNCCRSPILVEIELLLYSDRCRAPLEMFDASQPAFSTTFTFEAYVRLPMLCRCIRSARYQQHTSKLRSSAATTKTHQPSNSSAQMLEVAMPRCMQPWHPISLMDVQS